MAEFESFPPGTWEWLDALGYDRAAVIRIVKRRRHRTGRAPESAAGPKIRQPGEHLEPGDMVFDEAELLRESPIHPDLYHGESRLELADTALVPRRDLNCGLWPEHEKAVDRAVENMHGSYFGFKFVLDEDMPEDEIVMVSNSGSEVPDWFRKLMQEGGFLEPDFPEWLADAQQEFRDLYEELALGPAFLDAEPMTRDEIIRRREEGYSEYLLSTNQLVRLSLFRMSHALQDS